MKKEITGLDNFFYYLMCICSLGAPYFYKIIVKKAISEMVK